MTRPARVDWMGALTEVEQAVGQCLDALDHYDERFAQLLSEPAQAPSTPRPVGSSDLGWEARLFALHTQVDELEQLLTAHESTWQQWQQAMASWRRSVEQTPESAPPKMAG